MQNGSGLVSPTKAINIVQSSHFIPCFCIFLTNNLCTTTIEAIHASATAVTASVRDIVDIVCPGFSVAKRKPNAKQVNSRSTCDTAGKADYIGRDGFKRGWEGPDAVSRTMVWWDASQTHSCNLIEVLHEAKLGFDTVFRNWKRE